MRIAALGRTRMLLDTIRALQARGHSIPLIATCPASPEYDVREREFAAIASELGADFLEATSLNRPDTVARLRRAEADLAVSVNWLTKIGAGACLAFPRGILNAHAGDLPRYRGNAPVAWAILNGESQVGVTVHVMSPAEIDAGPILLKRFLPLGPETMIGEVFASLATVVPSMLVEAAERYGTGLLAPTAQAGEPLRCYARRPEDGRIDWTKPAAWLARLVRASSEPFAGAFADFEGHRLTIWRASVEPWPVASLAVPGQVVARRPDGSVCVATGDGLLMLREVQRGEDPRTPAGALITSTRHRLS